MIRVWLKEQAKQVCPVAANIHGTSTLTHRKPPLNIFCKTEKDNDEFLGYFEELVGLSTQNKTRNLSTSVFM